MTGLSRRTAFKVLAASVAVPLGILGVRAVRSELHPVSWQGQAMGAVASMTLWSHDPDHARRALVRMQAEVARLESIFSLYRPDSEISRLNVEKELSSPSRDLLLVLGEARRIADLSGGAFDPTIQPLWDLYASNPTPDSEALAAAVRAIDHVAINADPRQIGFAKAEMAISLNGIAQGYVTDRVTELLGNEGFENAVIQLGETRALGHAPDGAPFSIGLIDPLAPDRFRGTLDIADGSLAVSGGYGHRFDGTGRHHIFDPLTGLSANRLAQVAVEARSAMTADALSTAIYVAGERYAAQLLSASPGSSATLTRLDGTLVRV